MNNNLFDFHEKYLKNFSFILYFVIIYVISKLFFMYNNRKATRKFELFLPAVAMTIIANASFEYIPLLVSLDIKAHFMICGLLGFLSTEIFTRFDSKKALIFIIRNVRFLLAIAMKGKNEFGKYVLDNVEEYTKEFEENNKKEEGVKDEIPSSRESSKTGPEVSKVGEAIRKSQGFRRAK